MHQDSTRHAGVIYAGLAQRMSAGTGINLEGDGAIEEGDAVRFTATGGHRVTASKPEEVLVWEMHATLDGDQS